MENENQEKQEKKNSNNALKTKTKTNLPNYKIVLSICTAILACVVQILANFNIFFDSKLVADLITMILGALVFLGIMPKNSDENDEQTSEDKKE